MIKVLFDHQKFTTQKFGGISKYFATLIEYLELDPEFLCDPGVLYSDNEYLSKKNNALLKWFFTQNIGNKNFEYLINGKKNIRLLNQNDFDVFHPTYYDPYFLPHLKKPFVTTIHDMTYEKLPEYFWGQDHLTRQKRLSIERADSIIAISETTKNDLLELYPKISEDRVEVIYHGIDIENEPEFKKVEDLPEQYLLFVGDRSGYKNFYLTLLAFEQISKTWPDLKLVLVGGGNPVLAEEEAFLRSGISDKIVNIMVSDAELNYIYKNALLFIYPSLYEGFGLPILEAFNANCPVILSDNSCFKEVAADAAIYFESRNHESLANQILTLLNDETLRASLVVKGKERLKRFPITKCIDKTFDLYRKLA